MYFYLINVTNEWFISGDTIHLIGYFPPDIRPENNYIPDDSSSYKPYKPHYPDGDRLDYNKPGSNNQYNNKPNNYYDFDQNKPSFSQNIKPSYSGDRYKPSTSSSNGYYNNHQTSTETYRPSFSSGSSSTYNHRPPSSSSYQGSYNTNNYDNKYRYKGS